MFINLLTPKAGPPLEMGRINVVLGGNNSGKSTVLRDIFRLATGRDPGSTQEQAQAVEPTLIEDMQYGGSMQDEQLLQSQPGSSSTALLEGLGGDLQGVVRATLRPEAWNIVKRPVLHARSVLESELPDVMLLRTAFLAGETLETAADAGPAGSPLDPPRNLLQMLQLARPQVRAELDAAFAAAFPPLGLRLDESQRVRLSLRVAEDFPDAADDSHEEAQQWNVLPMLEEMGRGCRQFASLALAVLLFPGRIILADEPDGALEGFAARQLGRWLGRMVEEQKCQLVLAARSASLLAGLLERSNDVAILRLQRRGEQVRIGAVASAVSRKVVKSPMLELEPALEALLGQGAIVTQGSSESAIIRAVASQRGGAGRWSVVNVHHLRHAPPLLRMYRDSGLPSAVIGALDLLQSQKQFSRLLEAACRGEVPNSWLATRDQVDRHVSKLGHQAMAAHTRAMEKMLEKINRGEAAQDVVEEPPREDAWDRITREGTAGIPVDQRPWVEQLLEELKSAGLFIRAFGATVMGKGELPEAKLEKLIKAIRTGQCPDRLAVLVTEVSQYLRQPTSPLATASGVEV